MGGKPMSYAETLGRQLDELTLRGQDNMTRALREVEMVQAFVKTEEIVQGNLTELKEALQRSDAMKREVVDLLGRSRALPSRRLPTIKCEVTKAVEHFREGLAR
jgi:hypothetical protein